MLLRVFTIGKPKGYRQAFALQLNCPSQNPEGFKVITWPLQLDHRALNKTGWYKGCFDLAQRG